MDDISPNPSILRSHGIIDKMELDLFIAKYPIWLKFHPSNFDEGIAVFAPRLHGADNRNFHAFVCF